MRGAAGHCPLELVVHAAFLAHAGGVDEEIGLAFPCVGDVDGIAGRAGNLADDGARLGDERVDERRFSHVGPADDGQAGGPHWFFRLLRFLFRFVPIGGDGLTQIIQASAMRGRDGKDPLETEPRKFGVEVGLLFAVDLVGRDVDGTLAFAQEARDGLVQRHKARACVDDENDFRGRGEREFDFAGDLFAEAFAVVDADAARVDERQLVPVPARGGHEPVAGRARPVEDEGNFTRGQRVEEGRLPDVGTSYNGDDVLHDFTWAIVRWCGRCG